MDFKKEYFECDCGYPDHIFRVMYGNRDDVVYADFQFHPQRSFWKRIAIAFKYVFNIKTNDSPWEDIMFSGETIDRLIKTLLKARNKKERG